VTEIIKIYKNCNSTLRRQSLPRLCLYSLTLHLWCAILVNRERK